MLTPMKKAHSNLIPKTTFFIAFQVLSRNDTHGCLAHVRCPVAKLVKS